jgi:serine/threonine-protein kinase ULK/ATG1
MNIVFLRQMLHFVCIIDFGFAQYLAADDQQSSLRGSPLYMAPEILLKQKYDARVDLWSVGVIMYECLFGRAPYSSNNFKELAEKIKSQKTIQVVFHNHR